MRIHLIAFVLAASLGACALTYQVEQVTYTDRAKALEAAKEKLDDIIVRTSPAWNRVGGTLDFYVQDKEALLRTGFNSPDPDYSAETVAMFHQALYRAVLQRGSFDQVVLRYSRGEHIIPGPGQRVLYNYRPEPSTNDWYFSNDGVNRRKVSFPDYPLGWYADVQSWLAHLDSLAREK